MGGGGGGGPWADAEVVAAEARRDRRLEDRRDRSGMGVSVSTCGRAGVAVVC